MPRPGHLHRPLDFICQLFLLNYSSIEIVSDQVFSPGVAALWYNNPLKRNLDPLCPTITAIGLWAKPPKTSITSKTITAFDQEFCRKAKKPQELLDFPGLFIKQQLYYFTSSKSTSVTLPWTPVLAS